MARVVENDVTQEPSLRDTLNSAFEAAAEQTAVVPADKPALPAAREEAPPPARRETPVLDDEPPSTEGRKRRVDPKYPPEEEPGDGDEEAQEDPPVAKTPKKASQEPEARLPKSRAPGSWSPALRLKWAELDPAVQNQIIKREREIATGFNEVAGLKEFRKTFADLTAPYQQLFVLDGGRPLVTIDNLLKIANTLHHGVPMAKVQTVAEIIKTFGIDITKLDEVLGAMLKGGTVAPDGGGGVVDIRSTIQRTVAEAIAPLMESRDADAARQTSAAEEAIAAFAADPENEFFDDVKDIMADLMELAARRGQTMDLQTAYNRAILSHTEVSEIIQERKLQAAAAKRSKAAKAAKEKSVSVSGAPEKELPPTGESLRADLEAAFEKHST